MYKTLLKGTLLLFAGIGILSIILIIVFPRPKVYIGLDSVVPPYPLSIKNDETGKELYELTIVPLYDGYELDLQSTGIIGINDYRYVINNFLIDLTQPPFTNDTTNTTSHYQNFVIYFTGARLSLGTISLYNPEFYIRKNPYERISIEYIGEIFSRMLEGNFCIAFSVQHYITSEWLNNIDNCHLIILPKLAAYPYVLMTAMVTSLSSTLPSSMKVVYQVEKTKESKGKY